ncbi:MAG TPA: Gldg family protein [Candidatus Angelobacter sp.]|nr:Gldg family protein [Candidatus Angelobacter sp.]
MATSNPPQPSFSPRRKWSIALSVTLASIAVFAIVAGANYLSSQYFFKRYYLSADTQVKLSPRTISVLKSLTNHVDVTVYYDKEDPLYSDIVSLLNEYQSHTRKLSVKTVDYYREPGEAAALQAKYGLGGRTNRNFIIFDSGGRTAFVDGSWLTTYKDELGQSESTNQNQTQIVINRKRIAFNGEMLFTSKLFGITQEKPLKAYFLAGHGESLPNNSDPLSGYTKLLQVFHQNYITNAILDNLLNTNTIPLDCNLLVILGPHAEFQTNELDKIDQYLDQGGRLFALFDWNSVKHHTGLESLLAKWNVRVSPGIVLDLSMSENGKGTAFIVTNLAPHAITKPLIGENAPLEIVMPRPVSRIKAPSQSPDEPQVTELAYSSPNSILADNPSGERRAFPLMVAVEKGAAKGVVTERGTTRMLITGDSLFLNNQLIDAGMNQDFADSAVNWLLERTTLLAGVGPRRITEYRLLLNQHQLNAVKGILLGAIPGGILLFGGLVWLRRRK